MQIGVQLFQNWSNEYLIYLAHKNVYSLKECFQYYMEAPQIISAW